MAKETKTEAVTGERIYTIPLRKEWLKATRNKRGSRAVSTLRNFLFRHMKAGDVKISQRLNEKIWVRGIQKPPSKIKIKASMKDDVVTARLPEEMVIEKDDGKKGKIEGLKDRLMDARSGALKPGAGQGPEPEPAKQATLSKEETVLETEATEKKEPEPASEPKPEAKKETEKKGTGAKSGAKPKKGKDKK
jgi:large subunit ribosomal protein L31e